MRPSIKHLACTYSFARVKKWTIAEWSFSVFEGFIFLEAVLKILRACSGDDEPSIEEAKLERYGDEEAEENDDAEEDEKANEQIWMEKGLIFGRRNFHISTAIARFLVSH